MVPGRKDHTHTDVKIHIRLDHLLFHIFARRVRPRVQTCSEETINVHRLLLSISPHSSHGLDRAEGELHKCAQHHLLVT